MTSKIRYGICRNCNQEILFNSLVLSERSGNPAALNVQDSSFHRCGHRTMGEEERILAVLRYVEYINSQLKTTQLRLVREPKG